MQSNLRFTQESEKETKFTHSIRICVGLSIKYLGQSTIYSCRYPNRARFKKYLIQCKKNSGSQKKRIIGKQKILKPKFFLPSPKPFVLNLLCVSLISFDISVWNKFEEVKAVSLPSEVFQGRFHRINPCSVKHRCVKDILPCLFRSQFLGQDRLG